MKTHAIALTLALGLATAALGDVVHLKHGGTIEGQVVQGKDHVIVRLPEGEVRLPKSAVARIEERPSALDELQKRAAAIKANDAEGHYRLGLWAQSTKLKAQAREQFRKAIAIDPDHAQARAALGYRRYNGAWVTEEQEMAARGLVRHQGEWMTPQAGARLKQLQAELDVAREKRRAAEAQLKEAREQAKANAPPYPPAPPGYFANPYDRYYSTRDLYARPPYFYDYRYYHGGYPHSYYYRPYSYYSIPYGLWWFYPGGRRYVPRSRR